MNECGLPACRHRGSQFVPGKWICTSPKLVIPAGVVTRDVCRDLCPFVDHDGEDHLPDGLSVDQISFSGDGCALQLPLEPVLVEPRPEHLAVGMVSSPRPMRTVERSIAELRAAGINQRIHVFEEPETNTEALPNVEVLTNKERKGLWPNWRQAASRMLGLSDAPFLLLCEDDIQLTADAALGLYHAFETLPREDWGYASLYTPWHNIRYHRPVAGWQAITLGSNGWGALGYCFTRASLAAILKETAGSNDAASGHTDMIVTGTVNRLRRKCYLHVPSLCEHTGEGISSVGHRHVPEMKAVGFRRDCVFYRAIDDGHTTVENGSDGRTSLSDQESSRRLQHVQRAPTAVGSVSSGFHVAAEVGCLAVVTSFFNPVGYRRLLDNCRRFAVHMQSCCADLWLTELSFNGEFSLPDGRQVFRVVGSPARNRLWQKERLLNLLIERLPARYDAIAWVDADVLFDSPTWVAKGVRLLNTYPVVQLFSHCRQEAADGSVQPFRPSVAYAFRSGDERFLNLGCFHPGFAWAMRRETWKQVGGLLDTHVTGGGDGEMCGGFWGTDLRVAQGGARAGSVS